MPSPDSLTSGINNFIFDDLNNVEFLFEIIPINKILFFFEYSIIFDSSDVLPELLIKIRISFFVILPKSPCEQSDAEIGNDGVPTDDKVAEILDAIIPLLPTPHTMTLDLHLSKTLTASSKDSSNEYFNFFKALICKSITPVPIS